uniref:Battenin n=1 Tax=Magallana gigas TaxID=29159 RepID=K1QZ03_MAGGI
MLSSDPPPQFYLDQYFSFIRGSPRISTSYKIYPPGWSLGQREIDASPDGLILGLCNNFAYVIMLSAAHDILKDQEQKDHVESHNTTTTPTPVNESYLECNEISTGAILLADILPTLIIKLTAPFFILHLSYKIRVLTCVLFSLASFLVVSYSTGIWMSIIGVVCASISGGLGETTYFAFSSFFEKNVISAYSSGTGGAGIFGALSYAGLTSAGLSPRKTLLVMTIIPALMFIRHRIPKDQWWLKLRPLLRILTKHKEKAYTPEGIFAGVDDFEDEDNI